ncbi:hypothetical protein P170DRAFT_478236 [Aspergillus steynii IBT 23096]|uniref:Rhodopsin domain-containing protein n=1 Tax=Aspergillus steynii IBT 23096 TaxID=1392250 RepID=A0A2I2G3D0_9EURO|nr:uncharacterized protein P170DRAFT_478236 [Aspergillus steynii IBT 23096]PLB47386.1 hypothetical protein P170DRAFT_478236 [Aspergillus steynii IBT 23096]
MVEFGSITPAMPPPPGQSSNFINPEYIGTKFLVVNCVFLPLSAIALLVRTWTRLFIVRSFRSDDYLMIFAWILSCVLTGVTLEMLNRGLGRHMWDVHATDYSPWFLKLNMISAIFYCAATGFTKVSVLIFYVRIFPTRTFHICVWAIAAIAVLYNVASVFANFLGCTPIAKTWDMTITKGTCMNRPVFYFANAGLGIFTDFATVLVPIPWLRRLQMPLRQKIAVALILATGCFVGIVSCVRLATLYDLLKSPDLTWATTDALMWCTIELNLGITGGCVTAMRPFVRRYFPRLLGLSSAENTSRSKKYAHPLGSIPRSQPDFATPRDHQYSTTAHAHNDSEEYILSPSPGPKEDGILRTVEFDIENSGRR